MLGARFDPLAGTWCGRAGSPPALPARGRLVVSPRRTAAAAAEATEPDAWGNTRVTGVGRPPFPVELLDGDGEGVPR